MPYAEGRVFFDADSHIMETSNWLTPYADPEIREQLKPMHLADAGEFGEELMKMADERKASGGMLDDEADKLMARKGWVALGAFDSTERSHALDLLGFERQLVFSTFATQQFISRDGSEELLYGGTRAHNRAMADFCSDDPRLIAVGFVPLDNPDLALQAVNEAIELGCGAVMVPSSPPRTHSPTHVDLDPVWARLAETSTPLILHVGGGGRLIKPSFMENGRPKPVDMLGGGESFRSKDFMAIHNPPELFLSVMALDGVFERFPDLRVGCIEQGAMWVVPLLRRLDIAVEMFRRTEPVLQELPMAPSEYIRRQVRFTPFPHEDIGWLIDEVGPELFLFSSDYPHPEGTRDPLGRFEKFLTNTDEAAKQRFYSGNFADLFDIEVTAAA